MRAAQLIALGGLCGCISTRPGGPPLPPPVEAPPAVVQVDLGSDALPLPHATAGPEPYRLGVGDVLRISVYGQDASERTVPIDPAGCVSYMLVGSVPAAGRTIDELQADLQERLRRELHLAVVTVVPERFGSRAYTILGQVGAPGTYLLQSRTTILDAICAAGGLRSGQFRNSTIDLYDLRHATVMRDNTVVPVDFEALIYEGETVRDLELQDGDVINIPSALGQQISILGEVNFPRTLGFYGSMSLLQAISEARGIRETAGTQVVIVRGALSHPEATVVNLPDILNGRRRDVPLEPNDIVYVPPPGAALLREMVKSAVTGFARGAASESGSQLYREVNPDTTLPDRPIVVQGE